MTRVLRPFWVLFFFLAIACLKVIAAIDIPNWMESHKIPWFQTTNQLGFMATMADQYIPTKQPLSGIPTVPGHASRRLAVSHQ